MSHIKSITYFLCLYFVVLTNANVVPFIKPCYVNDDACTMTAAVEALPYFVQGVESLGIAPIDPMKVGSAEGGIPDLNLKFKDIVIEGLAKCVFKSVKRPESLKVYVEAECPISVTGSYSMKGNMAGIDAHGNGPCHIKIGKLWWSVTAYLKKTKGKDGVDYYKIAKYDYKYDPIADIDIKLDNLFEGDADQKSKAELVNGLLKEGGKEMIKTMGHDIFVKVFAEEIDGFSNLFAKIPAKEIELV